MPAERPKRVDFASKIIKASPQKLYPALVDQKALLAWLPPHGMKGEFQEFEPRAGGRYVMTLSYESAEHTPGKSSEHSDVVRGQFAELVPNVRVVQLIDFESDDPAFAGTMKMTWALASVAQGTEVSITCENVPDGVSEADHAVGLASSLNNLAAFVER